MKDRSADPLGPAPEVGQRKPKGKADAFAQPATLTAALALIAAMYLAREILIPIVLAVIFSFLVAPLVRLLQRARLNQAIAVLISVVVPLCIVVLIAGVVGTQVADLAQSLPQYRDTIDGKMQSLQDLANGRLGQFVGRAGQVIARVSRGEAASSTVAPATSSAAPTGSSSPATRAGAAVALPQASPFAAAPPTEVHGPPLTLVGHFLSALLGPLATAFIVFIVSIFMLLERNTVRDRFIKLTGARDSARTTVALDDTATRMSRYFVSQLGVNTAVGLVLGIGLAMLGIPSPVLWGVLAALLRFIPYIGVWIAGALACLLAAAVEPGWTMLFWTAGLFAVTELIAGQIVEPLLYGHTTGLSPLSVVVAAIFWSWLWGPVGLLLSTPLTLCLVVLGRYVERLNFLEILLGDKPQVTPAQQLYEHLSEHDVEAALKQAEDALGKGDACDYYDQILLPAITLLGESAASHSIDGTRLDESRNSALELVGELGPHLSVGQRSSTSGKAAPQMVCIAARGPMDEVVARAVTLLLMANGVEVLGDIHGAVPTAAPEGFDASRAHLCIVSAAPARSGSALHLTARRVRAVFPEVALFAGIYKREDLQAKNHEGDDFSERCSSMRDLLKQALQT